MLYPFMTLDDNTQIVHSETLPDGQVRVCVEQPVHRGFHSATCMLPSYSWEDVEGFEKADLDREQACFRPYEGSCGCGDIGGPRQMNKTLTVIRPGESHDDYSWALKLSDDERIAIADKLLRDLWQVSHGQPYPSMDRTTVHLYTSKLA